MRVDTFQRGTQALLLVVLCALGLQLAACSKPSPWRVVSAEPAQVIPMGGDQVISVLVKPYPAKVTLAISGIYPGLPKLDVAADFKFFAKADGSEVRPLQIASPKEIPTALVGDPAKYVEAEIYLADWSSNAMFGPIVSKGYAPEDLLMSFRGGPRVALHSLAPKPTK